MGGGSCPLGTIAVCLLLLIVGGGGGVTSCGVIAVVTSTSVGVGGG